jgi:glycosyltransferase involved in cell wall biosynthesis
MRIAVEATSLAQDRRGIGRYARRVFQNLALLDPVLRFTFFVLPETIAATTAVVVELGLDGERSTVEPVARIAANDYDLFWCPWSYTRHWPSRGLVAVTLHDVTPLRFPDQLPESFIPRLKRRFRYRRSGRLADLVLTDSEFSRQEIIRVIGTPAERIRVALLGTEGFSPGDRQSASDAARQFGVSGPFLLYVGGHEERKNLARMIRAFELLRSRYGAPTELLLAGPVAVPPPALAAVIDASTHRQAIHYAAMVSDEVLQELYRGAEALIYPSIYEGFGLPLLEAMASGTPVIASSSPSLPEVGGEAVLYFNPLDVEEMAGAMWRMLTDPELRASSTARGLAQAARYTWEGTARTTLLAFNELLAKGPAWQRGLLGRASSLFRGI